MTGAGDAPQRSDIRLPTRIPMVRLGTEAIDAKGAQMTAVNAMPAIGRSGSVASGPVAVRATRLTSN